MREEILNAGEKFIGVQDGWIVIEKWNGEIRLIRLYAGPKGNWVVDTKNEVTIARSLKAEKEG